MLARLILAIMLAVFAVPGMASACHDAAPQMAMPGMAMTDMAAMPHHDRHPGPATPHDAASIHACIGCIPPSSWRAPTIIAARIVPPLPRAIIAHIFTAGRASSPALPPPRRG